jgi:hypothetical protein
MNREHYNFRLDNSLTRYFFISKGTKGEIDKVVDFQEVSDNIYNLALGDYDFVTGLIDDSNVSDNGDMVKIFATVGQIVMDFLVKFPTKLIYIEANSLIKRKLYNRIIRNNINEIAQKLNVFGVLADDSIELFENTGDYKALILQKIDL